MSIHFAPQWVKPIKPAGSSATTPTTAEMSPTAFTSHPSKTPNQHSQVSFPALSSGNHQSSVSTTTSGNNAPMSYSRATHTPASPGLPTDGSYFPSPDANGTSLNPYPFRYSREQILNLFDEDKVKGTPIELVSLLEQGSVLVAPHANRPIGMREMNETEKKASGNLVICTKEAHTIQILSTVVHPAMPRRPQQAPNTPSAEQGANGGTPRRAGTASVTRDPTQPNGRGFGGFGRGEGGALAAGGIKPGVIGGGVVSSPGDGKAPGVLGGGFGGVGKRLGRSRMDGPESPSVPTEGGRPWRASRTASGNFEGVLGGFGGTHTATPTQPPVNEADESLAPPIEAPHTAPVTGGWRERMAAKQGVKKDVEETAQPAPAANGTPGWINTTSSKWRTTLTGNDVLQSPLEVPRSNAPTTASVIATPSATPVPDRDATVRATPGPEAEDDASSRRDAPAEDLGQIEWFYRDPQGQEHGPFAGQQMHEWYTSSYFQDELPVRRAHESGFHTLAELKQSTGNAVRPFVSAIRPRPPPPNLPMPGSMPQHMMPLNDNFRNLNIHPGYGADPRLAMGPQMGMPSYAPPFRNDAPFSPGQYGQQQGFLPNPLQSPGFIGNPGQSWAGPAGPGRFNNPGAFGSPVASSPIGSLPGHYSQLNGAFSPAIGGPVGRGPEFFSPSVGAGAVSGSIPPSPWALPPQQQQHQQQQAPQHMYPQQQHHQQEHQQSIDQTFSQPSQPQEQGQTQQDGRPSYFPQNDQEPSIPPPDVVESINEQPVNEAEPNEPVVPAASASEEVSSAESETADTVEEPVSTGPPASVWGAVPTSRRSSLTPAPASAQMSPISAAATTQVNKPASKPAAIQKEQISEPAPTLATPIETPDRERSNNTPKPAPWAVKDDKEVKTPSGPSLREIQEAEAKVAAARKQALAELRANNAAPSPALPAVEDMPTSMSWGLPQQGSKPVQAASPSVSSPAAPVWGSGDAAAPKKTMKQIQEEEEKRRAKLAHAKVQAQGISATPSPAGTPTAKRGYADLAATSAPPAGSGWQTVGSAGKGVPGSAAPPAVAARPTAVSTKSALVTPSKPATPAPMSRPAKSSDDSTPSADFIRWTKQSLNGLNVNIDEFIQMLLSFPIDPPQSERAGQLEIISDSVYANSSTLDGRRFAQEFCTRRKADSKRSSIPSANGTPVSKPTSLAEVLKTQPKAQSSDLGFKVVKAKGKKKN